MPQLVIDYKKSSNLIRITGAIIPVQCLVDFWLFNQRIMQPQLIAIYISLIILVILAQIVRKGVRWIKWPYLCVAALSFIFQLYGIFAVIIMAVYKQMPWGNSQLLGATITDGIFALVQDTLTIYSIYLLFVATKVPDMDNNDTFAIEKNAIEI